MRGENYCPSGSNDQPGTIMRAKKLKKVDTFDSSKNKMDENFNPLKGDIESKSKYLYSEDGVIDNFVHKWLWDTVYGRIANFTLLITFSYYAWFIPGAFDVFYEYLLRPSIILPTLGLELAMHLVVLMLVYPLSRKSSSTSYYWLIGVIGVSMVSMTGPIIIMDDHHFTMASRLLLTFEFIRFSMKIFAFLYECNKSKETFERSTFWTLFYFLFAPTLIYKVDYGKAKRVRPLRVIHHFWWLCIVSPLSFRIYHHLYSLAVFDLQTMTAKQLITLTTTIQVLAPFSFAFNGPFAYFEVFNGFFAELLRFPNRRHFGEPLEFLKLRKILRLINITVSDFIHHYIYKPIYNRTNSRALALSLTVGLSGIYHEVLTAITLKQFYAPILIFGFILAPLLTKRNLPLWLDILRASLFGIMPIYYISIMFEYYAWNRSTIPIENESKLRLIPLSTPYIARILFGQDVATAIFHVNFPPDA